MKTLILLRHARAQAGAASGRDIDRDLDPSGIEDARRMAAVARERLPAPQMLITSPAARAQQTTAAFADALDLEPREIEALYPGSAATWLVEIAALSDRWHTVIMVGHNPGISDAARELCPDQPIEFATCAWAQMESPASRWVDVPAQRCRLVDHRAPDSLRRS